jgi:hypothetical protein
MATLVKVPKAKAALKRISLKDLDRIKLVVGAHNDRTNGLCVMEAAAWVAGRPHTDHPPCVEPTIANLLRTVNDEVGDKDRQKLKAVIPHVVGTVTFHVEADEEVWDDASREYVTKRRVTLTPDNPTAAQVKAATRAARVWAARQVIANPDVINDPYDETTVAASILRGIGDDDYLPDTSTAQGDVDGLVSLLADVGKALKAAKPKEKPAKAGKTHKGR